MTLDQFINLLGAALAVAAWCRAWGRPRRASLAAAIAATLALVED